MDNYRRKKGEKDRKRKSRSGIDRSRPHYKFGFNFGTTTRIEKLIDET